MASERLDIDRMYRDHGHVVLRRARHILGSESDARDVMHEIFISLVENPHQFHGRSNVTTFLYAVTTNACLNRLRLAKRRAELVEQRVQPCASQPPAPLHGIEVAELLARLPERLARVAVYYFMDEMTHDEIAALLKVSRRHVGNLVNEVLSQTRHDLERSA